jgi:hypothetical protein
MHCDITGNNNSLKGKEQEITVTVSGVLLWSPIYVLNMLKFDLTTSISNGSML